MGDIYDMHLCQIKAFAAAIAEAAGKKNRLDGLNTMNWARIAYHASSEEYSEIMRDLQRD